MRDAPRSLTPRSLTCCRVLSRSLAFGASLPPACSLARGSTCTHVASSNDDVAVPVLLWLPRTISAGAPSLMHHTLHATDLRHLVQISRSPLLISATDLRHLNLAVQPPMTSHRRRSLYTQTRAPDHRGTQPRVSHEHRTIGPPRLCLWAAINERLTWRVASGCLCTTCRGVGGSVDGTFSRDRASPSAQADTVCRLPAPWVGPRSHARLATAGAVRRVHLL